MLYRILNPDNQILIPLYMAMAYLVRKRGITRALGRTTLSRQTFV